MAQDELKHLEDAIRTLSQSARDFRSRSQEDTVCHACQRLGYQHSHTNPRSECTDDNCDCVLRDQYPPSSVCLYCKHFRVYHVDSVCTIEYCDCCLSHTVRTTDSPLEEDPDCDFFSPKVFASRLAENMGIGIRAIRSSISLFNSMRSSIPNVDSDYPDKFHTEIDNTIRKAISELQALLDDRGVT